MERVVNRLITAAFAGVVGIAIGVMTGMALAITRIDRDGYVTDKLMNSIADYMR